MSYSETNLLEGETVIYKGKIHWAVFINPVIFMLVFIPLIDRTPVFILAGLVWATASLVKILNDEIAVTDKRIISKTGLIRRAAVELKHEKIESVMVYQSVLGRILNYGSIAVRGTGGTAAVVTVVENPMALKKIAMEKIGA